MAKGNGIIVSAEPRGKFEECYISGTPKPGTVMELKIGTAQKGGRWTYEPAGTTANNSTYSGMAADGNRMPIAVLCSGVESMSGPPGGLQDTAYADGDRGMVYFPVPGEELNMILKDESGTAGDQDFVPGTKLIVDDGTGKLIASAGSPESEPFICLETKADLAADYLSWCMYTGH